MLGIISSIFSGGLTGLLGVAFQRFFDFLKVKQELEMKRIDHEHEVNMRRIDGELMAQEWAARTQVATIEATARETVAAETSFASSFNMEPKQYSARAKIGPVTGFLLVLLDVLRGIVRPGLTIYLCVITTMIYIEARTIMAGLTFITADAIKVHDHIISTILYLTTTCVLWWFGTRNSQKAPTK
jgi:hypothetical protein